MHRVRRVIVSSFFVNPFVSRVNLRIHVLIQRRLVTLAWIVGGATVQRTNDEMFAIVATY